MRVKPISVAGHGLQLDLYDSIERRRGREAVSLNMFSLIYYVCECIIGILEMPLLSYTFFQTDTSV